MPTFAPERVLMGIAASTPICATLLTNTIPGLTVPVVFPLAGPRELHYRYAVARILVDPYQMHRSVATLQRAGLPIEPFPQTPANLTRMASGLYELIKGGNLRLYPDAELRWMAMNTVAVETGRGLRIGKERAAKKIDGIVALSMACVGCLDAEPAHVGPWVW